MEIKLNRKDQTETVIHSSGFVTVTKYYTKKDLDTLKPIIEKAQNLWNRLELEDTTNKYSFFNGNNYIIMSFLDPRCRTTRSMRIANAQIANSKQGQCNMEITEKIVQYLRDNGIDCRSSYHYLD